jgi:hypothetical protein
VAIADFRGVPSSRVPSGRTTKLSTYGLAVAARAVARPVASLMAGRVTETLSSTPADQGRQTLEILVLQTKQERQDIMPTEPANSRRVFRPIAGDRDRLPQHRGMSSEKQRQHCERQRQPDRQPEQRAAEGFFGGSPVPQGTQHEGEEQTYQAEAEDYCLQFRLIDSISDRVALIIGSLGSS